MNQDNFIEYKSLLYAIHEKKLNQAVIAARLECMELAVKNDNKGGDFYKLLEDFINKYDVKYHKKEYIVMAKDMRISWELINYIDEMTGLDGDRDYMYEEVKYE